METKDPSSIQYAAYNPRKMEAHDAKSLSTSMTKFGDISGITVNALTNTFVTGHMRMRTLTEKYPGLVKIHVEQKLEAPDEFGTVATGYVGVEGTPHRFAYREVSWPIELEKAANIAANRIEADWDEQMLAELNQDLSQFDNSDELKALSGQTPKELEKLEKLVGIGDDEQPDEIGDDPKEPDARSIRATKEQWELIDEALEYIKSRVPIPSEDAGSKNGSALYYMSRVFLEGVHAAADKQEGAPSTDLVVPDAPPAA
jgi:hypothetical protein